MTAPPTDPNPTPISRVLILGADGMLGRAWRGLLTAHGVPFDAADVADGDLTDPATSRRLITPDHSHVVNCAAWTDVDKAEEDEPAALAVNATAPAHIAGVCAQTGSHLLHYSTDYVFAGDATEPYRADQPRRPLGAYGRTKAAGEVAIERSGMNWAIVRTSWLYAPWANNFVRTIAHLAGERDALKVIDDQRGRPTSAEHLARASLALLAGGRTGLWHITDGGECTWFEFATEIVRLTGANCRVEPCTSTEFPRPAPRPGYSVLELAKTESILGPIPDWRTNLADVVRRLGVKD